MSTFELELPAVYLDPVILDTGAAPRLRLLNRNPEPAETNVPVANDVAVMIADVSTAAPGVDLAQTKIYVDGVLAYDGGSGTPFKPGWDGVNSAVSSLGANCYLVFLDHTAPFASSALVTVRVVSRTTDAAESLDASYTFTVADVTAPMVTGARSTEHKTVQVAFSEAMRALGDGAAADALTPGNYALAPQTGPAVTPAVLSVRKLNDTLVELTLDIEITEYALYLVTVTSAQDVSGNAVAAPFNTALFNGYVCPVPDGRSFQLWEMLPAMNRAEDDTHDLEKFIMCLQEIVDLLLCLVDRWGNVLDPDLAPEQFVDAMLADLGNPFAFDLTLEQKRLLLRVLVRIYKEKGTAPGIVNVIRFFLGIEVTVESYVDVGMSLGESELGSTGFDGSWELGPGGSWAKYAFNVRSPILLTAVQRKQILDLVTYMKPAHTHFVFLLEPVPPTVLDHLELGLSELGVTWDLH